MVSLGALPEELLLHIAEYLYIDPRRRLWPEIGRGISNLRLVCRLFSRIGSPFLYRHFEASAAPSFIRIVHFLRLVEQRPDLARYPRYVFLKFDAREYTYQPELESAAAILLSKLSCVKELRITTINAGSDTVFTRTWSDISPPPSLPELESLEWDHRIGSVNSRLNVGHLIPIILAARNLKSVDVEYCRTELAPSTLQLDSSPSLFKSLETTITDWSMVSTLSFKDACISSGWFSILFSATTNLKSFTYEEIHDSPWRQFDIDESLPRFSPLEFKSALVKVRNTLEVLALYVDHYCRSPEHDAHVGPFSDFSRLRTLRIGHHWISGERAEDPLSHALPSGLAELSLLCCDYYAIPYFAGLIELVQNKRNVRFPNLVQLEVRLESRGEAEMDLEKELWKVCQHAGLPCHFVGAQLLD